MANIGDLLSEESFNMLIEKVCNEGAVFRMPLSVEEGVRDKNVGDDGRTKYFVVLGYDNDGNAIGFVLITLI